MKMDELVEKLINPFPTGGLSFALLWGSWLGFGLTTLLIGHFPGVTNWALLTAVNVYWIWTAIAWLIRADHYEV